MQKLSPETGIHRLIALILFTGIAAGTARAEPGTAASLELLGGDIDGDDYWSGYGTLTVPLAGALAAHLELLHDSLDGDGLTGVGGHLYWQDTARGLLGLTASWEEEEVPIGPDLDTSTFGIEAEAYLGSVKLAGQVGYIDSDDPAFDDENYVYVDAGWAADPALDLWAGSRHAADDTLNYVEIDYTPNAGQSRFTLYGGGTWDAFESVYGGVEVQLTQAERSNWVAFLEGDSGEDDIDAVFVGLRYDFGPVEERAPVIPIFDRATGGF